ncbi:DUF3592 domain-containing protein [Microbulbifer sp. Q7]|uniref:DUF3592 domain-containing protein n=1 Tax=Microbulbifer sp. Q7 TaxID=1785091 RepID=UPI0009EE6059|nr:DUF3592 domain-containing protein [Microbulbifer sp. Q7]
MNNRYLLGAIAFLIFAWGGEAGGKAFSGVYSWIKSDFSNPVPGEITKSEMTWSSGRYGGRAHWDIEYFYVAGGKELTGHRVMPSSFGIEVNEVLSSYPVGKKVTVWHSESDLQSSMLEPRRISFMAFFVVVVSVVLPALITFVWLRPRV